MSERKNDMKHVRVADMEAGAEIKQFFLLQQKEVRSTRKGDPYWDVTLADASGSIKGKVWSDALARCQENVDAGDIVGLQGTVQKYQDEMQLTVKYLANVEHIRSLGGDVSGLDMALLLPQSPFDIGEMWDELLETVNREIKHEGMKELVFFILQGHEDGFKKAPAAQLYHHSYLGGLLEHTLTLLKSAMAWHDWEGKGNRDLLAAGAVLHDVGKILEIEGVGVYEKSVEGRLLGHLIQGRDLLRDAAREKNFSDTNLLVQLEHIILSHHGTLEFGSPVLPQTREAFIIHSLDDLNAKLKMIDDQIEKHSQPEGFTKYHRVLKRKLFVG